MGWHACGNTLTRSGHAVTQRQSSTPQCAAQMPQRCPMHTTLGTHLLRPQLQLRVKAAAQIPLQAPQPRRQRGVAVPTHWQTGMVCVCVYTEHTLPAPAHTGANEHSLAAVTAAAVLPLRARLCRNLVARSRKRSRACVRPPMCSPMICMMRVGGSVAVGAGSMSLQQHARCA